jgi:hypothetical protein
LKNHRENTRSSSYDELKEYYQNSLGSQNHQTEEIFNNIKKMNENKSQISNIYLSSVLEIIS